ncbi:MAG: tetratricopeptide repeat protein [Sphingobacteriales bacterium]
MKFRLFISALLIMPFFALAQRKTTGSGAIVAPARKMSQMDSLMVKQLFYSAMEAKVTENYSQAAEMFNRVLQMEPSNDAALYQLAGLKINKQDYANAQGLLENAVAVNPNNKWYWLSLTECYEKSNNAAKLESALKQLIRIDADDTDYRIDYAKVLYYEQKYDEALSVYDQIIKMNGGLDDNVLAGRQKIYLKQGKVDQAAAEIHQMIDANPSEIRYYLLLAELYNSNNFEDKALKVLQTAEKVEPKNPQLHLALADIYREQKKYEDCFNQIEFAFQSPELNIDQEIKIISGYIPKFPDANAKASALELSKIITVAHSDDYKSWAMYGDMLAQNEKYADAETSYRKSIAIDAQHYEVYDQLVRIEISNSEYDAAIKDGETALSYFPNQAWMNYLVGIAYSQQKKYDKAISYIKTATLLATDDKGLLSLSYSSLGDCYHELKDNKNSDDAYDKSLSYNPDNAFSLNNYAYYLSLRGEQLDKAAQMSAHSNELQPNTASFEDTYAWILFRQKKYADAKIWIEKAILHDKMNSAVQTEHYGDIMFYLGDTDAAVASWKKAKAHGQQSPTLERKINERKYVE